MNKKLTLILNDEIVERAKEYALDKNLSISSLVESYLQSLTMERKYDNFEISPFVKSMSTGSSISEDIRPKSEYSEYLIKKYK
ncbi:hypothetical protein Aeqsu_1339 [Aequorivita sublithincola DSM 14238]|uniref:Toxin-antitoxin system, antitoxin component, ribbon-helix-helix domain protein n=1 Tax=Aequorivita sublithincola (strain DSM 14238 / LMG 21431 / ACAM 643 / 9-3) TaxID=746697 RepID=I3YV14_AEQSU|nr:DUF6364 family protein [Aequorivita sublithincola]AFL80832.1 hypothetical protein Aeqsu_1339 [Aequorivita sublithincola DSM 14238]